MAFYYSYKSLAYLALALVFYARGILGSSIECENLNKDSCAFAISSAGKRCVLEHRLRRSGEEGYICRTSEIEVDKNNIYKLRDWVETDECIKACGLQRNVLGISSDSLLESLFRKKLCSTPCYHNCPNIIDLYFSLAAGEGVHLPKICELQGGKVRRGMSEIQSSGIVAAGPVTATELLLAAGPTADEEFAVAPAVAPLY